MKMRCSGTKLSIF